MAKTMHVKLVQAINLSGKITHVFLAQPPHQNGKIMLVLLALYPHQGGKTMLVFFQVAYSPGKNGTSNVILQHVLNVQLKNPSGQ